MDPRSEWALGEFRDAPIELRLLDRGGAGVAAKGFGGAGEGGAEEDGRSQGGTAAGGRVVSSSTRVAYQGECLAGVLVVKFDGENGELIFLIISSRYRGQHNGAEVGCRLFPLSSVLSLAGGQAGWCNPARLGAGRGGEGGTNLTYSEEYS